MHHPDCGVCGANAVGHISYWGDCSVGFCENHKAEISQSAAVMDQAYYEYIKPAEIIHSETMVELELQHQKARANLDKNFVLALVVCLTAGLLLILISILSALA